MRTVLECMGGEQVRFRLSVCIINFVIIVQICSRKESRNYLNMTNMRVAILHNYVNMPVCPPHPYPHPCMKLQAVLHVHFITSTEVALFAM